MTDDAPLWTPSAERVASSEWMKFAAFAGERANQDLTDPDDLHRWSIEERGDFWSAVWDYCGVIGEKGRRSLENADAMPGAAFFPDASLNFAENLLKLEGDGPAMLFRAEDAHSAEISWNELRALVSRLQQAYKAHGVAKGDRVAAMMPNIAFCAQNCRVSSRRERCVIAS